MSSSLSLFFAPLGDETQGFTHAKCKLYHQAILPTTIPPLEILILRFRSIEKSQRGRLQRILYPLLQNILYEAVKIHQDWTLSLGTCPREAYCIFITCFFPKTLHTANSTLDSGIFQHILEQQPSYLLVISSFARNVRPKMTIYVCQELEQNRVPLPQKQDGSGDNSLCGE